MLALSSVKGEINLRKSEIEPGTAVLGSGWGGVRRVRSTARVSDERMWWWLGRLGSRVEEPEGMVTVEVVVVGSTGGGGQGGDGHAVSVQALR